MSTRPAVILGPMRTRTRPTRAAIEWTVAAVILAAAAVLLVLALAQQARTDGPLPPSPWATEVSPQAIQGLLP